MVLDIYITFHVCTFHTRISGLNRNRYTLQYTWQTIVRDVVQQPRISSSIHICYSTCKWRTTRTELFDGISQQTPPYSRICGYLLWVQRLIPANLSHCVHYCIIMEHITTVPSGVLLTWDRILNIFSCSGLSIIRWQASFRNHVDFFCQLW